MADDEAFEALVVEIQARLEDGGSSVSVGRVSDILWESGIADLLEDLSVARAVIAAADGFHPVARFFADGSAEREFIRRTLADAAQTPADHR